MNFTELKTELSDRGFSYLTDTRLGRYVNWAIQEVDEIDAWSYRLRTSTGAAPLTITSLGWIQGVQETVTKTQLQPIDRESLADLYDDLTVTGTPQFYYVDGSAVNTFPVGGTLSVRDYQVPVDLTGTQTPAAPSRFHNIYVDVACRMAYRDSDNHQAAEQLQVQIDRDLWRMRLALLMNTTEGPDGYIEIREGW